MITPTWAFQSQDSQSFSVAAGKRESVPLTTLWPAKAVTVVAEVSDEKGKRLIDSANILIVSDFTAFFGCEMKRPRGKNSFTCLIDVDRDGEFDSYIKSRTSFEYFFVPSVVDLSKAKPLVQKVRYETKSNWLDSEKLSLDFEIEYDVDDIFNGKKARVSFCVTRGDLRTIWGGERSVSNCLAAGGQFTANQLPLIRQIIGSRIAVRQNGDIELLVNIKKTKESGVTTFNW